MIKFGRYASLMRDTYICLWAIILTVICTFLGYGIKTEEDLYDIFVIVAVCIFMMLLNYLGLLWISQAEGGHMSDYIVLTDDRAELHGKETTVVINWLEVAEIREVIYGRGIREIKIVAVDGTTISFTSHGVREKKIWDMHPELKEKYRRRCNH